MPATRISVHEMQCTSPSNPNGYVAVEMTNNLQDFSRAGVVFQYMPHLPLSLISPVALDTTPFLFLGAGTSTWLCCRSSRTLSRSWGARRSRPPFSTHPILQAHPCPLRAHHVSIMCPRH